MILFLQKGTVPGTCTVYRSNSRVFLKVGTVLIIRIETYMPALTVERLAAIFSRDLRVSSPGPGLRAGQVRLCFHKYNLMTHDQQRYLYNGGASRLWLCKQVRWSLRIRIQLGQRNSHPDPGRKVNFHAWWLLLRLDVLHRGLRRSSLIKTKELYYVQKKPCTRSRSGFSID